MKPWGLHWFRRDLRIAGNLGLRHNFKQNDGRVVGLFCFDSKFLSREDFSNTRFAFFLKTLRALKDELRAQGSDLLVVDCLPQEAFPKILNDLKARPSLITWNRDYEPFARGRDQAIATLLSEQQIPTAQYRDHLILEPHEVLKKEPDAFYQVYSPYARKWFTRLAEDTIQARFDHVKSSADYYQRLCDNTLEKIFHLAWKDLGPTSLKDHLDNFEAANSKKVSIPIPEAGFKAAFTQLKAFSKHLKNYNEARNLPFEQGTSRLSMFLKNGSLISTQIFQVLSLRDLSFNNAPSLAGAGQFAKELVWREFYYQILFHRPDVEKQAFLAKYQDLKWLNREDWFRRWCEGKTGFPIVDAGMRELNTTGWMHNRVRMIVASFLTKDLLIDWRWGENYFMKHLLDGDLAANNGGWQWAASTGCDPQPYFRIFNPWLQSKKFDPEGKYIKTFVPELKNIPPKHLHAVDADRGRDYPQPIVRHEQQRAKALALYK